MAGGASAVCATATDAVGDGCPATQATFSAPKGLKFDPYGNLIIADSNDHRIRSINLQTGIITTIAGTGTQATSVPSNTTPLPANQTPLAYPYDTAFDVQGNMYIVNYKGSSFVSVVARFRAPSYPAPASSTPLRVREPTARREFPAPRPRARSPDRTELRSMRREISISLATPTTPCAKLRRRWSTEHSMSALHDDYLCRPIRVAATAGTPSSDGGNATQALLAGVQSAILDKAGNLYPMQASGSVNRIAKISPQRHHQQLRRTLRRQGHHR